MSSIVIKDYAPYTTASAQDYANIQVQYKAPVSGSQYTAIADIACPVVTQTPTSSPTIQPTDSPIMDPTPQPSPAPTHDEPGVFIDDICSISRCECFAEARDCCMGSDPSSQGFTCEQHIKYIEIQSNDRVDYQEDIRFSIYPNGYTADTLVYYQLTAYGQLNSSDFYNLTALASMSPKDNITNTLKIEVDPIGSNAVYYGNTTIADGDEYGELILNINAYDLKCYEGDICVSFQQCFEERLLYELTLIQCDIDGKGCMNMYPSNVWISVGRSSALCNSIYGMDAPGSSEVPDYVWWVVIALIIFAMIMGCLIYRFWWKQKRTVKEIGTVQDDLMQTVNEIEQGVAKDLDRGDIMFNQFATGVPNYVRPMDPAGNELYERQQEEQNQFAHVDAEEWVVREVMGPQSTDNSIHSQQQQSQQQAPVNTGFAYTQYPYPTPTKYNRGSKSHSHSNSQ